jgi:hypothetical protein
MMTSKATGASQRTPLEEMGEFRLEVLELLPCGCVVAVQRMAQSGVRVVSLEAKGPHCLYLEHRANKVIRLGEVPEAYDDEHYDDEGEAIRVA